MKTVLQLKKKTLLVFVLCMSLSIADTTLALAGDYRYIKLLVPPPWTEISISLCALMGVFIFIKSTKKRGYHGTKTKQK